MAINQVTFNSVNFWEELGAALTAPVAYPIPAEIKENVKIKGMNGSLTEATGYFNDLEIELNFKALIGRGSAPEARNFNTLKRKINEIFNNINDTKLRFSDVEDRYYKVKSCVVGAVTKISDYEAEFDVEFTCDPFLYDPLEEPITSVGKIKYNGDIPNAPIIRFTSSDNGQVDVVVNGNSLTFSSEESGAIELNNNPYTIVTENGKPLKSVGNRPILTPGDNTITIRGPISDLQIIKNERYLG